MNPSLPFCILETHFVVLCEVTSLALLLVHLLKGFLLCCRVVFAVIMFSRQHNNGNVPEIKQKPAITVWLPVATFSAFNLLWPLLHSPSA